DKVRHRRERRVAGGQSHAGPPGEAGEGAEAAEGTLGLAAAFGVHRSGSKRCVRSARHAATSGSQSSQYSTIRVISPSRSSKNDVTNAGWASVGTHTSLAT